MIRKAMNLEYYTEENLPTLQPHIGKLFELHTCLMQLTQDDRALHRHPANESNVLW